jgi:hypothetical protein
MLLFGVTFRIQGRTTEGHAAAADFMERDTLGKIPLYYLAQWGSPANIDALLAAGPAIPLLYTTGKSRLGGGHLLYSMRLLEA